MLLQHVVLRKLEAGAFAGQEAHPLYTCWLLVERLVKNGHALPAELDAGRLSRLAELSAQVGDDADAPTHGRGLVLLAFPEDDRVLDELLKAGAATGGYFCRGRLLRTSGTVCRPDRQALFVAFHLLGVHAGRAGYRDADKALADLLAYHGGFKRQAPALSVRTSAMPRPFEGARPAGTTCAKPTGRTGSGTSRSAVSLPWCHAPGGYLLLASLLFTNAAPAQHTTLRFDHLWCSSWRTAPGASPHTTALPSGGKARDPTPWAGHRRALRPVPEHLHRVPVPAGQRRLEERGTLRQPLHAAVGARCQPDAFGLIAEPFDTTLAGFHLPRPRPTRRRTLPDGRGQHRPTQPLLYASMPHRAHKTMSSMEEVERADPAIREDLRHYLSHPSGIRRLTGLVLTVPDSTMGAGTNVALLQDLEGVEVREGDGHALTLEFDGAAQGREFRWSEGPELRSATEHRGAATLLRGFSGARPPIDQRLYGSTNLAFVRQNPYFR